MLVPVTKPKYNQILDLFADFIHLQHQLNSQNVHLCYSRMFDVHSHGEGGGKRLLATFSFT